MKPVWLFATGAAIFGVTFVGWYWLNALACGMNPTGCRQIRLNWGDWEALRYFLPTFGLGVALMAFGLWRGLRR